MVRSCFKSVALAIAIVVLSAIQCIAAFQLVTPTEGKAVRENVKIQVPASAVPDNGFISVLLGEPGKERFVVAISRESAKLVNQAYVFYWDSKAPFYDPKAPDYDPMKPKQFKDGRYSLAVHVHDATGRTTDQTKVNIELKNRVPRTNPAPGVVLSNRLLFGQVNDYRIHTDVSVFDVVNGMSLPLLGGLGMSADSKVVQSVEDVRPGGQFLLRYRVDDKTYVAASGYKKFLYDTDPVKPQLYRLMDSRGNVIKRNMFTKQARFQIMDILPVLPKGGVKEGDSWPDTMTLKIDGMTALMTLKGSSMLDSFEWENGRECAKIISILTGTAPISLVNGKVRSSTGTVTANVTTYFAYKSGKMLERRIRLTTDVIIMPGAGDSMSTDETADMMMSAPPGGGVTPYDDVTGDAPVIAPRRNFTPPQQPGMPPGMQPGMPGAPSGSTVIPGTISTPDNTNKKGKVEFDIVIRLEK